MTGMNRQDTRNVTKGNASIMTFWSSYRPGS